MNYKDDVEAVATRMYEQAETLRLAGDQIAHDKLVEFADELLELPNA